LTFSGLRRRAAMAPVLSFTAEEVWGYLPWVEEESVHLAPFPDPPAEWEDEELAARWEKLLRVRGEVSRALEVARKERGLGNSLNAAITLYPPDSLRPALEPYEGELAPLFIVSAARLSSPKSARLANGRPPAGAFESQELLGLAVLVEPAPGQKCERCWNVRETVGKDPRHPSLCDRCAAVVG
ncbi:MAG: zinc finger domain-containing protein, partial [Nitrospinota bacterium]